MEPEPLTLWPLIECVVCHQLAEHYDGGSCRGCFEQAFRLDGRERYRQAEALDGFQPVRPLNVR